MILRKIIRHSCQLAKFELLKITMFKFKIFGQEYMVSVCLGAIILNRGGRNALELRTLNNTKPRQSQYQASLAKV